MRKITIALDWTANTNHTGFYVALKKGFYKDLNIVIETTEMDNYTITPAKKVSLEMADVALCPFESILSYRTIKAPFNAVAIATIFQEDISAIASLESSNLKEPKDLDGCIYASYKARYEDRIVQEVIRNNGGEGTVLLTYPEKLGIWNTLLEGKADATWIFKNWEGIRAKSEGVALNLFKMEDYGIPYGYSPVLMADKPLIAQYKTDYQNFLKATKRGYLFAQENPQEAVACIAPFIATQDKNIMI